MAMITGKVQKSEKEPSKIVNVGYTVARKVAGGNWETVDGEPLEESISSEDFKKRLKEKVEELAKVG